MSDIVRLTDEQKELVEDHSRLVTYMVYKVMRSYLVEMQVNLEEAVSIAYISLCKSAQTYDPEKGAKFSTYAYLTMRYKLIQEAKRQRTINEHELAMSDPMRYVNEHNRYTLEDTLTAGGDPCYSDVWVKDTLASIDPRVRPFFAGEMNQTGIARQHGISNALVSRLVNRERVRMQRELEDQRLSK